MTELRIINSPEELRAIDSPGLPVTDSTGRPGLMCSRSWIGKEPVLQLAGTSGYTEIDNIDYPLTVCPYYSEDKEKMVIDAVKEYGL